MKMKKAARLISGLLAIAACISMLSVSTFAAPAQPTREEAVEWLYAQEDQSYDLDGKYGAQCVDIVSAYMNWLPDRDPYSGRYGVYYAYYYPTVAGWRPDLWEVIPNTPELVPQPGDIFVSRGSMSYGHVGVVLFSTVSTATVIDQNSVSPNETTGHPAVIHDITWAGAYAPTYFIRYRGYAASPASGADPACDHSYLNCVEAAHPHRTYQYCADCGDKRYTGSGSYSSDCEICNPASRWTDWSAWSTGVPAQAPNREVEKREVTEGYNLVVYVTQEAAYPYRRNLRNYSVNGSYGAYGLRAGYGEHAYRRYASKAEVDAAGTCREGEYIWQDSAHVGGYYCGSGTAYYFPDGYYWYVESPVTRTEYRFRDRLSPN